MPIHLAIHGNPGQTISRDSLAGLEDLGFSSLVLGQEQRLTQNLESAALAGSFPGTLTIYAAHWAGAVEPTTAANQLAYLDHRLAGRLGLRVTEGSDAALGHEATWRRIDEYLTLLKRLWSNEKPIDHECEFYSVKQGFVANKGPQGALVPIRMTGLTGTAAQVCARHATTFEIAFGPVGEVGAVVHKLRESSGRFGRSKTISFALDVPEKAVAQIAPSRASTLDRIIDLLRPYVEAGVSEFTFDASVLGRLGSARFDELRLALDSHPSHAPAALDYRGISRLRRVN